MFYHVTLLVGGKENPARALVIVKSSHHDYGGFVDQSLDLARKTLGVIIMC